MRSLVRMRGKSKIPGWTRFSLGQNNDWPRRVTPAAAAAACRLFHHHHHHQQPAVSPQPAPGSPAQAASAGSLMQGQLRKALQLPPSAAFYLFDFRARPSFSPACFFFPSCSIGSLHATGSMARSNTRDNSYPGPDYHHHHPGLSQWVASRGPN
jgi:hypothetical protein